MGVVFFCVTMLWIFFKLPNFDHALGYLEGHVHADGRIPIRRSCSAIMALLYALPVLIQHLGIGALLERQIAAMGAVSLWRARGAGLARGRAGRRLHLFPVLTMPHASRLSWLIKCAAVAVALLLACGLATARFGSALQQPAVTTRDGTIITLNRYVGEPVPDLVLVGSSVAWRLKEEYFSHPRVRNLALAGGSPVTGLEIVAKQKSLPKIVLIETNVLTRQPDDALIEKFSGGARTEALFLRPVRTAVAAYETLESHATERCGRARRAGSPAQRAAEHIRQQGLSRPCAWSR